MAQIVLPEKYYLTHFLEFIAQVKARYLNFCNEAELRFLTEFECLSEDAQCLFVRIANRRGRYFHRSALDYAEIQNLDTAIEESVRLGFLLRPSSNSSLSLVLGSLDKARLQSLVKHLSKEFRSSWPRSKLIAVIEGCAGTEDLTKDLADDIFEQARVDELEYLKFLYFGEIRENLQLYTLRDLGVRRAGTLKESSGARFRSSKEARSQFFYARLKTNIEVSLKSATSAENLALASRVQAWPEIYNSYTFGLREGILVDLAAYLTAGDQEVAAEKVLAYASSHPGTERHARLLYKLGKKEESLKKLEAMIDNPSSDSELSFAEDFLLRKFNKKRSHIFTDMLNEAQTLTLDEAYLQDAETGVQEHFRSQGKVAFHSENYLWNALFGLVFWEEIFEAAGVYSVFERIPQDLLGGDFYSKHYEAIEKKLGCLDDPIFVQTLVSKNLEEHFGVLNGVFNWQESLRESLPNFVKALLGSGSSEPLKHVLRAMVKDYANCHSGFPDLFVEDEGGARFVEVKAEGDQLRASQFQRIKPLRDAGFAAEVLKVAWRVDPELTYVVMDLETTGTSASHGRVTEIGAVKIRKGMVIEEFTTLVNPGRTIPKFITQLTGISDQMVANAPRFAQVADRFADFTKDAVFVAHNVSFDYGFVQAEFARLERPFLRRKLCTRLGMKRAFPGLKSYGLKALCEEFKIDLSGHHRAYNDAVAASKLLLLMNEMRSEKSSGTLCAP